MRASGALRTGVAPGGAVARPFVRDPDAVDYIRRVEVVDDQPLEPLVKTAITNFVLGCKSDGIWDAIKASCILAGARTLNGALVPLAGTAPTNFNFVSGDYDRKTGLVGDGSTKYLNSGRANNADPQNSKHLSAYLSSTAITLGAYLGAGVNTTGTSLLGRGSTAVLNVRTHTSSASIPAGSPTATGFYGWSRGSGTSFTVRISGANQSIASTSQAPSSFDIGVFARISATVDLYVPARIAFYSIGESLNLALLDARVADLINSFGAAIP